MIPQKNDGDRDRISQQRFEDRLHVGGTTWPSLHGGDLVGQRFESAAGWDPSASMAMGMDMVIDGD